MYGGKFVAVKESQIIKWSHDNSCLGVSGATTLSFARIALATVRQLSRAILEKDPTQLEYYENITKNMFGQVLTKRCHITSKTGDTYALDGFDQLTQKEASELLDLCRQKIKEYEERRGEAIWAHRKRLGFQFPMRALEK